MKKIIFLFALITIELISFSQNCNINDAEKVALNTISERFSALNTKGESYRIKSASTEYYGNEPTFYVFNLSPTGFIVVSAQKNTVPVLAFSTSSEFDYESYNPAAQNWLENYSKQIYYNIEKKILATETISAEWDRLSNNPQSFKSKNGIKTVAPLLKTTWNQGRFYNTHCPDDPAGSDGHAVTGCVATALGQLINYFRYPNSGTGSYGYEHPTYGWLEVNFAEQNYNYDQMPTKPTDYNDDIARLIYNIGVSVDMNYGPQGSGMNNHKGAYTLYTYFDYDPSTTYLFRDSLPLDFDWNGTLVQHLDQNIPLYYAGWSDYEYIMGHAFIFDGYSDQTHYHINWGWGGSMDGYFYIEDLTPGSSDFTLLHEVIVNAVPTQAPQYCSGTKELSATEGTIEDGSGPLNYYQNDMECAWLISSTDSINGIKFEFVKFILDENDYLVFYNGANDTDPVLHTIYGNETPSIFESTSENVLIKFFTNSDSVNDGWLLKYNIIKPSYCALITNLTEPSGTITDGSNSYQYQNGVFCNWKIKPVGTENILISFEEFDVEPINDYVKILNSSDQLVAKLSGNTLPDDILIIGNKATVVFDTDESVRAGGFKINYQTNVTTIQKPESNILTVYPNPASDKLFINFNEKMEKCKINLLTIDGKICMSTKLLSGGELNIESLNSGIYIIEIISNNETLRQKFVKN